MPLTYIEDLSTLISRSKMSSSRTPRAMSPPSEASSSKTSEATVYILGWYFFSLSISIYNKWMFGKGLDFHFPILVTSFHQFCLMILSSLVLYMKPRLRPTINEPERSDKMSLTQFLRIFKMDFVTYMKQIFPCSLASSGDIGLSNVSFRFISLSLYTMLKTSSLTFVLLFGLLFRLEKFNWRLIVIVLVMSGSVVMMVNKPDAGNSEGSADSNSTGIILVLLASMASGLRWSFTQLLLKRNPYTTNSISTIFYISPSMCMVLFVFGLIFEGWSSFMAANIWEIKGTLQTIVLMIIPGVLAFMMTLCEFKLLSVTQVITLSIAGIFKELLTIILSSIIFGDKLSLVNILGLVFTFADILWYNYYRYMENRDEGYVKVNQEEIEMSHKG